MTNTSIKSLSVLVSKDRMAEIDAWIAKYPKQQRQSAVMSTLRIVQEQFGHLTEALMDSVAQYLNMPSVAVYEVATFYTMYENKPCARHLINVCTNISCKLNGSDKIVEKLKKTLGVDLNEMTPDKRFEIRSVECLGACVNAPMMQIDKTYHEHLDEDKLDNILEQYS